MSGLYYALGAMLFFGIADFIYKRGASAGAQAHQFLMVQSWFFAPTVLAYAVTTGTLRFVPATLWGAFAGVFALAGFYNFAHSLRTGAISINAPIFRLSFVLTSALAFVFLGEPLTAAKSMGIGFALAAVWLLLGTPAGEHPQDESVSSLARVIAAMIFVGIGSFIYSLGLRGGATAGSVVVAQAAVVVPLATLFSSVVDRGIKPSAAVLRYAPRAAVMLAAAFVLMVEAMARIEASVAVPIAQMGFVVNAMLGVIFLRESFTARKLIGIAAAFLALVALSLA